MNPVNHAVALLTESARQGDSAAYFLAPALFSRSPSTALTEYLELDLPKKTGPGALGGKAFLLALTPGHQSEAIELADRLITLYADFDTRVDALCASLLAGDKTVVGKARSTQSTSYANFHNFDKMMAHLAETDKPGELESIVQKSSGGHVAYYVMGVKSLSTGNRVGARRYFELCAKSPIIFSSYPLYARAILVQMNSDKSWPEWLPPSTHTILPETLN